MPKNPLFSTYRGGENRVTSSMLAVFERISLDTLEELLARAMGEASLGIIEFRNQLDRKGAVPDGSIKASLHYLFEVKTGRRALDTGDQLRRHLKCFDPDASDQRLFVVTPDAGPPRTVTALEDDQRVCWFSFSDLDHAIDQLAGDDSFDLSDHEKFLLRELRSLFALDGLLSRDDVLVVAANIAYGEYLQYGAYICQPNRSFRDDAERVGFYAGSEIKRELPRILSRWPDVVFSAESAAQLELHNDDGHAVAEVIRACLRDGSRKDGQRHKVLLLTRPGEPGTAELDSPVQHDGAGAWVQGQRYARFDRLMEIASGPSVTSALETP